MKRRIGWTVSLFALSIGLGLAGCATAGTSGDSEPATSPEASGPGVQVDVTNEQTMEAEVWVSLDGVRQRVGRVRSYSKETFRIPMDRTVILSMEFRLFGGATCTSRELSMAPGGALFYTIPTNLQGFDGTCRGTH